MSETTWANLPKTCPEFVEHPHIVENKIYDMNGNYKETRRGGCYTCQVALASEEQGTTEIASALMDAGIHNVEVEQTGGFCMAVYVYGETQTVNICANKEGAWIEFNENGEFKECELFTGEGATTAEIVEAIKKNIHLIK